MAIPFLSIARCMPEFKHIDLAMQRACLETRHAGFGVVKLRGMAVALHGKITSCVNMPSLCRSDIFEPLPNYWTRAHVTYKRRYCADPTCGPARDFRFVVGSESEPHIHVPGNNTPFVRFLYLARTSVQNAYLTLR